MEGICNCPISFCTLTENSSTNKVYKSLENDDQPACEVPSDCSTVCPPAG
jgi:hypothetical protein